MLSKKVIKRSISFIFALLMVFLTACTGSDLPLTAQPKEATQYTKDINDAVYDMLDFNDKQEVEFAERGLLASPEELEITDENGKVVWSQKALTFVENAEAPASANPSLWRHTQMNHLYGLFEVTDGIYQVRGYDLSNITFIEGNTGWIVFDPATNIETSKTALQLINETLGERPVTGIIISHSHTDHYNGIKGVVSEEEVAERNIPIIVPEGFEQHAVSENVYAGNAMLRRAEYMYGKSLEPGVKGRLAVGLGIGVPNGTASYIAPNDWVSETGETRTIDGVTMEFQITPGTEAPVEMNTWFADKKAFWAAENCTGTLHNLYTLRGAQVRDGNAWAKYLMESVSLYGEDVEVVFQSHNWPHWGNDVINEYMLNTAAAYKFINDQTLLYINQGYTSDEISNMIKLPENLEKVWYTRQYYGTVAHDAKGVYQRYMGWYDANPAHLNPLMPTESAKKTVEYMGGAEEVMKKAKADFAEGNYQWVAEVTMALVYDDPENKEARLLCADALEQLGYQSESGVWRAAYLTGAEELRDGNTMEVAASAGGRDILRAMEPYMVFDYMGIHLDSNAAKDLNFKINFDIQGDTTYVVTVKSGVLLYQTGVTAEDADATVTLKKEEVAALLAPNVTQNEQVDIEGDETVFDKLNEHMITFTPDFNIIEP